MSNQIRTDPPIDAETADQLLPLLASAIVALVEESDIWLTAPLPIGDVGARFSRAEALGEDIAALARAGRVVLRNRAGVEGGST
jgi:hypothetical protein